MTYDMQVLAIAHALLKDPEYVLNIRMEYCPSREKRLMFLGICVPGKYQEWAYVIESDGKEDLKGAMGSLYSKIMKDERFRLE